MNKETRIAREAVLADSKGFVVLGAGGRRWDIKFGFRQLGQFERLTGKSTINIANLVLTLGVDTVVKGLWVLMHAQDPKITENRICAYLDEEPAKLNECTREILAAIIRAMPEPEDDEEEASRPLAGVGDGEVLTPETGTGIIS